MELRYRSTLTLATLHILLFLKSQVRSISGLSVDNDPKSLSSKLTVDSGPHNLLSSKSLGENRLDTDTIESSLPHRDEHQSYSIVQTGVFPEASKRVTFLDPRQLNRWSSNGISWGPRGTGSKKWSSLTSWGKRNMGEPQKKWTHFHSFGKRSSDESDGELGTDKRWKEMSVWGKRSAEIPDKKWQEMAVWGKRTNTVPNKKWNDLAAWGKRDKDDDGEDVSMDKKWKEMSVWGKRDADSIDKKWKEMSVWGKRDADSVDKKWKEMSVWGKRDADSVDKKWKEMSVWGKRDVDSIDKKWKEMSVWGKRDFDAIDKKWKEMSVWGKRANHMPDKKWKEMSVWGKRSNSYQPNKVQFPLSYRDSNSNLNVNKKWKEMAVWGKRIPSALEETPVNNNLEKKWKEVSVWGKRSLEPELDKRWKEMAVWGKRSVLNRDQDETDTKTADDSVKRNSKFPIWDKRPASSLSTFRPVRNWRDIDMWGKRPSWSRTGFSSWGKRSALSGAELEAREGVEEQRIRQEQFQRSLHALWKYLSASGHADLSQGFPPQRDAEVDSPNTAP